MKFWPKLKALYLWELDRHWCEKLPDFKELRILQVDLSHERGLLDISKEATSSISRCQNLRMIDIYFPSIDKLERVVDVARGCPLLRGLRVETSEDVTEELEDGQFSRLVQALPLLEFLSLDFRFTMYTTQLRQLAVACPQLAILELKKAEMKLSVGSFAKVPPLWHLKAMELEDVWFTMRSGMLQGVATVWSRVFPSLRTLSFPEDFYTDPNDLEESESGDEVGEHDSSRTPEDLVSSPDAEHPTGRESRANLGRVSPNMSNADCSDSEKILIKLRKRLGYRSGGGTTDHACHMWRTNLEIETIGWPVIPVRAFLRRNRFWHNVGPFEREWMPPAVL